MIPMPDPVIYDVQIAHTFTERLAGLLGRRSLAAGIALYFPHCRSVHTFFMRFPIDLVFIDGDGTILRIARNVKPWRMAAGPAGTRGVLELSAGWLPPGALREGARITLSVQPAAPS